MTESFEDAIKALRHIARGNGSVLRIADRIVAAHERETKVEGVCGPITGELRGAWMCQEADTWMFDKERFTQLCDAIDSIHAQLERENEGLRVKFVNANRHAQHVERENESLKAELDRVLGEHGNRDDLLQLPLDADRVPIFIGDVMESDYITRTEVVAVGIKCFFAWSNIDRRWHQYEASQFRHHQPDTWERIIEDVLQRGHDDYPLNVDTEPYVARCKKLAGDAE